MKQRMNWINGLKGILCLFIIMTHCPVKGIDNYIFTKIAANGARGVQFFFVISSFLIFMSLNNRFKDNKITFKLSLKWMIEKVIKLLPLYYIALITHLITNTFCMYWLGSYDSVSIKNVISHFLLLHGFNPYYICSIIGTEWYIGVLVIFYMIAPFFYKKIGSLENAVLMFGISLFVCKIIQKVLINKLPYSDYVIETYITNFSILGQFSVIMLGLIFYYFYKNNTYTISKKMSYAIFIISIFLIISLTLADDLKIFNLITLWGIACFLIMISLRDCKNILIDNIIFNTIGKYSYGIYMFHFFIINRISLINISIDSVYLRFAFNYTVTFILSFILSFIFTNVLEKPVVKIVKSYLLKEEL